MSSTAAVGTTGANALLVETLDPLVSLYRVLDAPSSGPNSKAYHQPRLIIIASWTDAKDVHIAKYVIKYQELYPTAEILLLKSTTYHIIRPSLIGPSMKHAASVVRATLPAATLSSWSDSSLSSPSLLIHMFSNGGSSSIANLYEQYAAMAGPDNRKALPPHVTIFDSCPGVYSISHAVAFIKTGLSPVAQLIATPILYAWAALWSVTMALGLSPDSLNDWGKAHNNGIGNSAEVRRVYIYSPSDALIDHKGVEKHAVDAKNKGYSVKLERYEGSAHVAHLRKDEIRYWEIVRETLMGHAVLE